MFLGLMPRPSSNVNWFTLSMQNLEYAHIRRTLAESVSLSVAAAQLSVCLSSGDRGCGAVVNAVHTFAENSFSPVNGKQFGNCVMCA